MSYIDASRVISMTELQKLSLKKLRSMGTPLFVIDRKSQHKAFVIVDFRTFELFQGGEVAIESTEKPHAAPTHYDFKARGLFWDRPAMTNRKFAKILKDPKHPEYVWAVSRLLERLPSQELLQLFSLATIEAMLNTARIRSQIRRPWEHAINYWRQKSSRRR